MKIAIFGKEFNANFNESILLLFSILEENSFETFVYKPFYDFMLTEVKIKPVVSGFFDEGTKLDGSFDFLFSIGGDGTFLEAISYIWGKDVPIVGINTGRLGFLAYVSPSEIGQVVQAISTGRFQLETRDLIELNTPNALFGDQNFALNELTVLKKDSSAMITIHVFMDNEFLNTYWADGLIIATPTGSTAYSLSAGGPIVVPNSQNFVVTPLAPHNLTVRPLVVPNDREITIKVTGRSEQFLASLDYRSATFDSSIELAVRKAPFQVQVFRLENHNFFSTLRNKLMWGVDKRN